MEGAEGSRTARSSRGSSSTGASEDGRRWTEAGIILSRVQLGCCTPDAAWVGSCWLTLSLAWHRSRRQALSSPSMLASPEAKAPPLTH